MHPAFINSRLSATQLGSEITQLRMMTLWLVNVLVRQQNIATRKKASLN